MPRPYVSGLVPVLAVLASVGIAYGAGLGPFGEGGEGYYVFSGSPGDADVADLDEDLGAGPPMSEEEFAEQERQSQPDDRVPLPPAVDGVHTLYDDLWSVTEGQWFLADGYTYDLGGEPTFRKMFESVDDHRAIYITTPGFWGSYRATVQLHDRPPSVPTWCEDLAEASLDLDNPRPSFTMNGFEEFGDKITVPAGSYRVRYCTEKQDRAAAQPEMGAYAGRHLIQLWRAPIAPDEVVREGSRWARSLARS